ncbi:hypothetical protein V6N11_042951 [Hibiscus sabdariffa]|uniref:PPPDE domain-containing protein n=1 Tax=Hibiscus sabdariffa TaxID=183260 RepID=A0ABR2QY31_9ROSI
MDHEETQVTKSTLNEAINRSSNTYVASHFFQPGYFIVLQAIDAKIRQWFNGKQGNIRSLLSTLQYVLWADSGWKPVPLTDIIEGRAVKKSYQKALPYLHPDELQQKGAASYKKYIAEKVFDILQAGGGFSLSFTSLQHKRCIFFSLRWPPHRNSKRFLYSQPSFDSVVAACSWFHAEWPSSLDLLCLGIFHSGVEVYGVEYAFGAHDYPTSGVFEVEPGQCPGFKFKKSIFIGTTSLDPGQVRDFMEHYSERYNGDTYHLIAKNCNHFCADICKQLTGKRIPKWVNRLAKIGSMCNCILPEGLKTSVVKREPNYESEYSEKKRRRCGSSCLALVSGQLKSSLLESSSSSCLLAPSESER